MKYVISAELESSGLEPPRVEEFRKSLSADLQARGEKVEWAGWAEMKEGLRQLGEKASLPIISLDTVYFEPSEKDGTLAVSRAVKSDDLSDAGYDARLGTAPLKEQLDMLGERYRGQEVALLDDVLFSGEMAAAMRRRLMRRGVRVPIVVAGVAIGEGAQRLADLGVETRSAISYDQVRDQLCERDFTYLPGSGRKVSGRQQNVPYFDPAVGRPEQWASLKDATNFCATNIRRNLELLPAEMPLPDFLGYPSGSVGQVLPDVLAERSQR